MDQGPQPRPPADRFSAGDFRVPLGHLNLLLGDAPVSGVAPEYLASTEFLRRCLDHMRLTDDEAYGLAPTKVKRGSFGMILAAASQADSFAGALERFAEAARLIRPDLIVAFRCGRRALQLSVGYAGPRCARREILVEIFALTAHCGLRWLTGRRLPPLEVRISTPAPPYERSVLRHVLGCPLVRREGDVAICYPLEEADVPLQPVKYQHWAAHELGEFTRLLDEAAAEMGRPRGKGAVGLVAAVRELIVGERLREAVAARRLGMSPATLRRRLAEEGVSFRALWEEARRSAARTLLSTGRSIEDVAADLGFSDARSLRRASRRWFGVPPGVYRRKGAKKDAPAQGGRVQGPWTPEVSGVQFGGKVV